MLRQQVSPKTAAIATLIILALIQAVYWRLLVYREPATGGAGGGGAALPPAVPFALGREDVLVERAVGGGPGYRDGDAWKAQFNGPNGLAVHPDGSLIISDSRNHRIRRMQSNGQVTTIAGGADPGGAGAQSEGAALEAGLRFPSGVAVDPEGTVYLADTGNHRICKLVSDRLVALAGGGEGRADGAGPAAKFRYPAALAWEAGALWVADLGNGVIRRVDAAGGVSTPPQAPPQVLVRLGDVGKKPAGVNIQASPDGRGMPEPVGMAMGRRSAGAWMGEAQKLFADLEFHVVMAQRGQEPPLLIAGRRGVDDSVIGTTDGFGHRASFAAPCAVAAAPDGSLYLAEYEGNCIRRLRLPDWMRAEQEPPVQRRGRWRNNRGG